MLMLEKEVVVGHTLREGNMFANFFNNQLYFFVGTNELTYSALHEVPTKARGIIHIEKLKCLISR